jgi:hypothetical protein
MFKSIYTREYIALVRLGLAEPPPVSGGKGDQTLKDNEASQAALNKQLAATFTTQLGKQSAITDALTKKLQPMIDNPSGFSPEALTALRTSASDTDAAQANGARTALQDQLNARGGLPSGADAQLRAQIESGAASTESNAQNNITLQNEQQKQQNLWQAVNALSGNAQIINPLGYSGGATSGAGAVANLGQAYQQSKQSQLLGVLGGIAGGVAGGAGGALAKHFGA